MGLNEKASRLSFDDVVEPQTLAEATPEAPPDLARGSSPNLRDAVDAASNDAAPKASSTALPRLSLAGPAALPRLELRAPESRGGTLNGPVEIRGKAKQARATAGHATSTFAAPKGGTLVTPLMSVSPKAVKTEPETPAEQTAPTDDKVCADK
jgi:hypothetical protein